ncbi:hypothetical protein T11_15504 [Trichinella zimbabwensis]|uniref:Uncharacterized protein n=1 Tax=Trichinella zimbabwensis TaxID=268475 RepID=A0A0V1DT66_9BILA|nr:hypothetical protein T11_15504 [Trichinella zimbabwensis]
MALLIFCLHSSLSFIPMNVVLSTACIVSPLLGYDVP